MTNRLFAVIFCALAALLFIAGCSKSPEEKLMGMVEGYAKILTSNENDCSKAGKELDAYIDKNKAEFTAAFTELMNKAKDNNDPKMEAMMKDLEEKYKGKFDDKKIDAITEKCEENPEFKAANEKLGKIVMGILFSAMAEGFGDALKDAGSDDAPAADAPAPAADAHAADAPAPAPAADAPAPAADAPAPAADGAAAAN